MVTEASPLQWPEGWKRTIYPIDSRFGSWNDKPTIARATDKILHEMNLFGGEQIIISTDLRLKKDGLPYSNQKTPDDPGVAVYFNYDNEQKVIACDSFNKIGCNLWAVAKTIEAMRGIDRWGCSEIINKAFTGFTALPQFAGESVGNWWNILDVEETTPPHLIKLQYKRLVRMYHPDNKNTGNAEMFMKFQNAYNEYLKTNGTT